MPSQLERQRRYDERLAQIMSQADVITEDSLRRLLARLEKLRSSMLEAFAREKVSEWGTQAALSHYRQMVNSIDAELADLKEWWTADAIEALQKLVGVSRDAVSGPLAAGSYLSFRFRSSITDMAMLYEYVPELIAGITDEARREITRRLRSHLVGSTSAVNLTDWLQAYLSQQPDRQNLSRFGPLPYQAERLWRTEAQSVLNMGHQLSLKELHQTAPKWVSDHMRKWWRHGFVGRLEPREAHVAAEIKSKANPIPLDELFSINGNSCTGPHDPSLPAAERIFCGCTLVTTVVDEAIEVKTEKPLSAPVGQDQNIGAEGKFGFDVFLPSTGSRESRMARVEEQIKDNHTYEVAVGLDSAGKLILGKRGKAHSVSFNLAERKALKNSHLTHNHPSGSSLSPDDGAFAIAVDLAEIRAVGVNPAGDAYLHTLKRGAKGWDVTEYQLLSSIKKHQHAVTHEWWLKVEGGKMTVKHYEHHYWHEVWRRVAKELGLNYRRRALKKSP